MKSGSSKRLPWIIAIFGAILIIPVALIAVRIWHGASGALKCCWFYLKMSLLDLLSGKNQLNTIQLDNQKIPLRRIKFCTGGRGGERLTSSQFLGHFIFKRAFALCKTLISPSFPPSQCNINPIAVPISKSSIVCSGT